MEQALLRNQALEQVNKHTQQSLQSKNQKLFAQLKTFDEFKNAKTVGLFVGKDHEPHTLTFIQECLTQNKKICLPKIVGGQLEFRRIKDTKKDLTLGKYNILEPADTCPLVRPHNIPLLCIPATAVDKQGNRIGRGKGYYDRYLEKACIRTTAALVYNEQVAPSITPQLHDQSVDTIITDTNIIACPTKKPTKLLNGIQLAKTISVTIKEQVKTLTQQPKLSVILVGNHHDSRAYVLKKKAACEAVGIACNLLELPETITEDNLLATVQDLNQDNSTHGILVQLPLPIHINTQKIVNAVIPEKDVDGLTEASPFTPCAPAAIIELLQQCNVPLKNKTVALVGYGKLIGQPLHPLLEHEGLKVNICTKETPNTKEICQQSDIIISATGVAHLITAEYIQQEAIVIDAGFGTVNGYCVGDVNFEAVFPKTSFITPSPGGVGPLTITMLLKNVLRAIQSLDEAKEL